MLALKIMMIIFMAPQLVDFFPMQVLCCHLSWSRISGKHLIAVATHQTCSCRGIPLSEDVKSVAPQSMHVYNQRSYFKSNTYLCWMFKENQTPLKCKMQYFTSRGNLNIKGFSEAKYIEVGFLEVLGSKQ